MREALNIINSLYERIRDWHPGIKRYLSEYIVNTIARELRYNHNPEIHQSISDLITEINNLQGREKDFIINYLEEFGRKLEYDHNDHINLFELYNLSGCDNYNDFVIYLLNKCYNEDDYNYISEICSLLMGNLPHNNDIRDILLKCILDNKKSNRLRERIFWIFNYDYIADSIEFFKNKLDSFLKDNFDNIELTSDIINYFHWNMSEMNENDIAKVKKVVRNYLSEKPEVKEKLDSITKETFEI